MAAHPARRASPQARHHGGPRLRRPRRHAPRRHAPRGRPAAPRLLLLQRRRRARQLDDQAHARPAVHRLSPGSLDGRLRPRCRAHGHADAPPAGFVSSGGSRRRRRERRGPRRAAQPPRRRAAPGARDAAALPHGLPLWVLLRQVHRVLGHRAERVRLGGIPLPAESVQQQHVPGGPHGAHTDEGRGRGGARVDAGLRQRRRGRGRRRLLRGARARGVRGARGL
mmetsp:Transcript_58638/g.160921  ORF Transcript_58638/g.160921 Transcript_58638/m.160921 type:complete len:224 (-) Transcript_58638:38-709(-)